MIKSYRLILAIVVTYLYAPPALSWIPCQPICDLQCSGLAITVGATKTTLNISKVSVNLKLLSATASKLQPAYNNFGVELVKEWANSSKTLNDAILTPSFFKKSYNDSLDSAFAAIAFVFQSYMATYQQTKTQTTLSTMNAISETVKNGMLSYYSADDPKTASLDLMDLYDSILTGVNYLNRRKQADYDKNLFQASQRFVEEKYNNKSIIMAASYKARSSLADRFLGLSTEEISVESDPYLARSNSVSLRRNMIDLQSNRFISNNVKEQLVGLKFHNKINLYGINLANRNINNVMAFDRLNLIFRKPLTLNN